MRRNGSRPTRSRSRSTWPRTTWSVSPELQSLPVRVTSLQQGVEVLEFQPTTVPVALDRLAERQVRVEVETGDRAGGPGHRHPAHQPRGGDRQRPAEPARPRGPRRGAGPDLRVGHRRPPAAGAAGAGRHRRARGRVGGAGAGHHPGRDRRARGRDEQDRADPAGPDRQPGRRLPGQRRDGRAGRGHHLRRARCGGGDHRGDHRAAGRGRRECGPRARRDARPARRHPHRRGRAGAGGHRQHPRRRSPRAPTSSASPARERPTAPPACRSRSSCR